MPFNPQNSYTHFNSTTSWSTGVQINSQSGPVTLERIVVNLTTAGTIGIIDGTSGTTVNVAQLKASIPEGTYYYNVRLANGLRLVMNHPGDITVVWRQ